MLHTLLPVGNANIPQDGSTEDFRPYNLYLDYLRTLMKQPAVKQLPLIS